MRRWAAEDPPGLFLTGLHRFRGRKRKSSVARGRPRSNPRTALPPQYLSVAAVVSITPAERVIRQSWR